MPSPIQLVQRIPGNQEIDVQGSLHAFAKELITWRAEERKIRHNRRYRNAVRAVFKANGNMPLTRGEVIRAAIGKLRVKTGDNTKTLDELWDHVTYNRQYGYLALAGRGMNLKTP